jgi:hypothetical protein
MPIKPALRYLLVRHGGRVVSEGADLRLGTYYDVDHHPYQATVYVRDRLGQPAPLTRLVARAHYAALTEVEAGHVVRGRQLEGLVEQPSRRAQSVTYRSTLPL